MKKERKLTRIWVPTEFKSFLHRRQSEEPLKTRSDILKDIVKENSGKKGKNWFRKL